MSGDPEQEYFSDGISEDIITALSKLRWFFVIARNSSFIYKGKAVHLKQIADELGVGYVVEGSVRKAGDRVRITAQLNDVATGSHIWAERYDRRSRRRVRGAGRDHRSDRRGDRAAALCRGEFPRPAQAARQPGRLGPGDARAVALLAGDAAGQRGRAGAARKGDQHRSRITARRSACSPPATCSAPIWAGWTWRRRRRSRNARRWRRSGPTAKTRGRTSRSATCLSCWRAASTIRSPNTSWRCGSIRTSRWRRPITGCRCPTAAAGRRPTRPRAAPCA